MQPVDIRMPEGEQEGTEASLGVWLKQLGDAVAEDEPVLEIATDKVTVEVSAPASGVLTEMCKTKGDTVRPGDLLGRITVGNTTIGMQSAPHDERGAGASIAAAEAYPSTAFADDSEASYSPAVRRLLKEHRLDPRLIPRISKTGRGRRLTIDDVTAFLADQAPAGDLKILPEQKQGTADQVAGRKVPHTPMRKSIANHMTHSVQTAPHVTSVFEADLSAVLSDRAARKAANGSETIPSITAYLMHAALKAIQCVPEVNSRWHENYLEVFDWVNFGVGTALATGGLVVPVIHGAQDMDLLAIAQNLQEMTQKARSGRLTREDMSGGTFTLSNHGVSGSLLAAPIILPDGQAAILGAGKMQRRVIVCESGGRELFRIRPMMYVTLTIDHRVLDGMQANAFLTRFVTALEAPNDPLV